jgi:bifunctional enzyme CysN/CysC
MNFEAFENLSASIGSSIMTKKAQWNPRNARDIFDLMGSSLLRFTMTGSVDDGKSTLIGRLLHDHQAVHDDQLDSVRKASRDGLDFAMITDGLRVEREQGITIDVAYRYFSSPKRRFIVADTPGHDQYTRNMITGSSTASVAVVLVDVTKGMLPQTRRHAYLSWMLGIRQMCVAVNKMDVVSYERRAFDRICLEWRELLDKIPGCDLTFIPVSALAGDNVVHHSERMPWFDGPSLLEYLETIEPSGPAFAQWLRLPIQSVIRGQDGKRYYAGRLIAGSVCAGERVLVLPSGRSASVTYLSAPDDNATEAVAPVSVSISLDQQIDISRGDMIVAAEHPPAVSRRFIATLFWMGDTPFVQACAYALKHTTNQVRAEVTKIISKLDIDCLEPIETGTITVNDIGRVEIETRQPLFCDRYTQIRETGSFILIDPATHQTVAAGMIEQIFTDRPRSDVTFQSGRGAVVWLTGLSSAGKSTIAEELFDRLRAAGRKVEILDADIIRQRLCKDLTFSKQDRDENIRRIGFVAELLSKNGLIVIVAAISPYRAGRDEVRNRIPDFIEVYVNAPLDVCEHRDVKGLYRKAREGKLQGFTGIDDPYEPPLQPEVECRTDLETVEASVQRILGLLRIE